MLTVSFDTTFQAMLQVFILGAIGFVLVKAKFLKADGLELLSGLLIHIILPAFNFSQIIAHFQPERFLNWWVFPLLGFGVTLGGLLLASLMLLAAPGFKSRREFKALVAFQNSGYLPLTILAAFPPSEAIAQLNIYILIFLIGFDILLWTLGVWLLTSEKNGRFDWKKLISPPMLATITALILMFTHVGEHIPLVILKPVKMLGDCLLPLVMVVLGGNFALTQLKKLPVWDVAAVILTKLFLYPVVMLALLAAFPVNHMIGFLLILEAAVPCANTLSVITRYYRTPNQDFINQSLFFTNVLSVLTIPLFLALYAKLM